MQIKRFEAKNMTEALRQIKRELGPEAVILSAKDMRRENRLLGISRKIGVEVTAAVDEDTPALPSTPKAEAAGVSRFEGRAAAGGRTSFPYQGMLHTIYDRVSLKGRASRTEDSLVGATGAQEPLSATDGDVALTGSAAFSALPPRSEGRGDEMARFLVQSGLSAASLKLAGRGANFVALVGNPGVGKTTTIAKLAAWYTCRHKESVGLISMDRRRIGGFEQLRRYADVMALPFEAIGRDEDLSPALKRLKACRLVLVDTPAVDPGDVDAAEKLAAQFAAIGKVTTLLTISAESREADLRDTAARCSALRPTGMVVTKTDLTRCYDDVVNFLCWQRLPVLFLSNGRRVPLDFTPATIEALAARLLQKTSGAPVADRGRSQAPNGPNAEEERSRYLANKSSDIFHRPDCKWIRLINQANIVEFGSFAEALNHRFKPCRYCNPQHLSITGILSRESAAH